MQPDEPKRFSRPIIIVGLLMLTTWMAVGWDLYGHYAVAPEAPYVAMGGWGVAPGPPAGPGVADPIYTASITTDTIKQYKKTHKLILLTRNNWATSDRLNDTEIEKSNLYTIDDGEITLQFVGGRKIRYAQVGSNSIEFYIIMIPNGVEPDQITKLSDLDKLGGKILARNGQVVSFAGTPPNTASPSSSQQPVVPPAS